MFGFGCTRGSRSIDTRAALGALASKDLESAKFESETTHDVKTLKMHTYTGRVGSAELEVTRMGSVDSETATRWLDQKRYQMRSYSQEQRSPYPGEISSNVKCDGGYLPRVLELKSTDLNGLRVEAAANTRKNIGVCGDSEFALDAVLVYAYCRARRELISVEAFFPRGARPQGWPGGLKCGN